jgi:hypothetical protein
MATFWEIIKKTVRQFKAETPFLNIGYQIKVMDV